MHFYRRLILAAVCVLVSSLVFAEPQTSSSDNADPACRALRDVTIGPEAVAVSNLEMRRDIGLLRFTTGTFYFLAPVEGKVTGAVFIGDGRFVLEPSASSEKRNISILAKTQSIDENFGVAVIRFTDASFEEIKKAATAVPGTDADRARKELSHNLEMLRKDRMARYNLSARILQDVLATSPGSIFYAFIEGKKIESREVFAVDPQGVVMCGVEPEEVCFSTFSESNSGIWYAGHLASEQGDASGSQVNAPIDVKKQVIDAEVEKSGSLHAKVTTTIAALRAGIRVVPLSLFRNFRVSSVVDASGQPLQFVMEEVAWNREESDDSENFNVILPKPLVAGETFTFTTIYGGKEAITNEGGGNYFPVARHDWYPSPRRGDYAEFEITLRVPKGMKAAATGTLLNEANENGQNVSRWRSEAPISVAGFNFGRFKTMQEKAADGMIVQSFANEEPPDWVSGLKHAVQDNIGRGISGNHAETVALGSMDTTSLMKKPLAEGQLAIQLYTDFFGPTSFKNVALTQQTACNFGQAWPGLVWLPICAFYDSTVRHELGIDDVRQPYWNVVTSHEVAHQWWGHTVGWASYRDQWMSEGFAQVSASIFLQAVYSKDQEEYLRFWRSLQEGLLFKNRFGYRPIDIGPVTMGARLNNTKSGSAYTVLIYGKGAYILHMIRHMMWDPKNGEERFRAMMQDFVKTYHDRPASTEDFKAVAEKYMTPAMDLDGNKKLDWFFNEYVYGTELPIYDFAYEAGKDERGTLVSFKLTQSNVSKDFKMLVPIYAQLANGRIVKLGTVNVVGNATINQKIPFGNMEAPKKLMINHYYDVLSGQ